MSRLWPDEEPERAAKRLRQTLWRIRRLTADRVITATQEAVGLADGACVDFTAAVALTRVVLSPAAKAAELAAQPLDRWDPLSLPLLPGTTGEEVQMAQRRWDRLRQLSLERLADVMLLHGDIPAAAGTPPGRPAPW
jgi:DNA-binding SARP family transcriptional activator